MEIVYTMFMKLLTRLGKVAKRLVGKKSKVEVTTDGTRIYDTKLNNYISDDMFESNLVLSIISYDKANDTYRMLVNTKYISRKERSN